jgi:hypothetical protein
MASSKPLTSWSFSRYSDYKRCPLVFKAKHIDKIAEPKNAAMDRGNYIHKLAEDYLKGKLTRLPKELVLFKDEFKKLKAEFKKKILGATVEDTWAFTKDWDRTRWDDWIKCWVRIKLDCAHYTNGTHLVVTDWKTGKFREDQNEEYMEQLELYALAAFMLLPHVETVEPRLAYTDQGIFYPPASKPVIYDRKEAVKLRKIWEKRVAPMFNDKRFAPKANDKCKWCFYGQSGIAKGGPGICKF